MKQVARMKLPADFSPSPYTVLCGKGKDNYNSVGNRRFRVMVSSSLERYTRADTKLAKGRIVQEIIHTVRSAGGGFVKFENGAWYETGDEFAREKTGALFRDYLHGQYRSSAKAKTALRRAKRMLERSSEPNQAPLDGLATSMPRGGVSGYLGVPACEQLPPPEQSEKDKYLEELLFVQQWGRRTDKPVHPAAKSVDGLGFRFELSVPRRFDETSHFH